MRAEYLRLKLAAQVAGIEPAALEAMAEQGRVPYSTLPGSTRKMRLFRRAEMIRLRELIEQGFAGQPKT